MDIIVTAKHGFSFREQKFKGDHGLLTRDNMVVPLMVDGPSFRHEFVKNGRTSDVFKFVLKSSNLPDFLGGRTQPAPALLWLNH